MEPLSAMAIASLLTLIAGKAGEKVLDKSLDALWDKANLLRQKIWDKLKGNLTAEAALIGAEQGEEIAIKRVASYLDIAMGEDSEFEELIQQLAQEIEVEAAKHDSPMTMNIFGNGKGWQTKVEGGTAYIGENTINQYQSPNS
jgi:hypothetical protein